MVGLHLQGEKVGVILTQILKRHSRKFFMSHTRLVNRPSNNVKLQFSLGEAYKALRICIKSEGKG